MENSTRDFLEEEGIPSQTRTSMLSSRSCSQLPVLPGNTHMQSSPPLAWGLPCSEQPAVLNSLKQLLYKEEDIFLIGFLDSGFREGGRKD